MIELESSRIAATYLLLLAFGLIFNVIVAHSEKRGWLEGYTSLAVALGVAVTICAVGLISWQFALVTLGAFGASGMPMIAGSIWRHMQARERSQKMIVSEILENE